MRSMKDRDTSGITFGGNTVVGPVLVRFGEDDAGFEDMASMARFGSGRASDRTRSRSRNTRPGVNLSSISMASGKAENSV
jgi:hypothetical protein